MELDFWVALKAWELALEPFSFGLAMGSGLAPERLLESLEEL